MITWGVNSSTGKCAVFCMDCCAEFGRSLTPIQARERKQEAQQRHHCTPAKPWKHTGDK